MLSLSLWPICVSVDKSIIWLYFYPVKRDREGSREGGRERGRVAGRQGGREGVIGEKRDRREKRDMR